MVLTPRLWRKSEKKEDQIPLETMEKAGSEIDAKPLPKRSTAALAQVDPFRGFVLNNLKQRDCVAFCLLEETGEGERFCFCGHLESEHQQFFPHPDPNFKWNPQLCTVLKPTTAFGEILFAGFGSNSQRGCPYARVDSETSPATLWKLLHEVWGLSAPKLVISVTGGARRHFMKPRLKNAFKQGLIDVASTTDAWIISGGTCTGVMKDVGEALHEHHLSSGTPSPRMAAIGIASWGCVDNRHNLDDPEMKEGLFPAMYNLRDCTGGTESRASRAAPLDHNHTHFILADNGTVGSFGVEIHLRAELESYIGQQCAGSGQRIPVVLIVCEGGVNTLTQAREAVDNEIPLVIIKSSGRAADVIATGYALSKPHKNKKNLGQEEGSELMKPHFRERMELLLATTFGFHPSAKPKDEQKLDLAMGDLMSILTRRYLITVFELSDTTCRDMDKAVLSALLKAKQSDPQSQMDLALIWDRADIARISIFTLENRSQWQGIEMESGMQTALVEGKPEFVQLFIDNGVRLGSFLTTHRLRDLYQQSLHSDTSPIAFLLRDLFRKSKIYENVHSLVMCRRVEPRTGEAVLLQSVGRVLRYLLNDNYADPYSGEKFVVFGARPSVGEARKESRKTLSNSTRLRPSTSELQDPANHLFLWALIFRKSDIARMLWGLIHDPIGGALLASQLLKALAREANANEEIDLSVSLMEESRVYEQLASNVLSTCYQLNRDMSHLLLRRELRLWGNTTLFSLAETAELMDFMQLSSCQTMLNQLWYGDMTDFTADWKILMVTVFPVLVPLIKFKKKGENKDMLHESEKLDGYSCTPTQPINSFLQFYDEPVTKFYFGTLYYMLFLGLFTFVVLAELKPFYEYWTQGILEVLLWVWVGTLFFEDFQQIWRSETKSPLSKLWIHLSRFWNQVELLMVSLVVASVVLRVQDYEDQRRTVKTLYAFAILLAYLRIMEAFYVSKNIGPKIIMIQKMLKDLVFFLSILAVFILGFGVPMQALLHPQKPFSPHVLLHAVYVPYWQIFGELFMERVEGDPEGECRANVTASPGDDEAELESCPERTLLVPALSAVYMMLTNVLLLNLLIAMFSHTFQSVQDNSEKVWRFHRYSVVRRYYDSPALPPPLSVFCYAMRIIDRIFRKITRAPPTPVDRFKRKFELEEDYKLSAFEKAGREQFLAQSYQAKNQLLDTKVTTAATRIDKVMEELEDIKEFLSGSKEPEIPSPQSDGTKMESLERTVRTQTQLLRELLAIAGGSSQNQEASVSEQI